MINNEGHSGGLVMLWKEQRWGKVIGSSRNHIDIEVTMTGNASWRLTGYNSYLERARRKESWQLPESLS